MPSDLAIEQQACNLAPIPILTYHQIAQAPASGAAYRSLYVSPTDFGRQMAWLRRWGYRGLSLSALTPYLLGHRQGKVVGITFDDGYLNNLSHAAPVLQACGFSSTCYVVSGLIGATNQWDRSLGVAQSPLMDAAQLRQWIAAGQEVGAHTQDHARLDQIPGQQAQQQIRQCRADLESLSGQPVRHFCYPYGVYKPEHRQMVSQAGYTTACTTHRGRCIQGDALLELPRVPVLRSTSWPLLWCKLNTRYEDRRRP